MLFEYDIVGFVSAIDPATIVVDLNGDEVTVKLIGVKSAGVGIGLTRKLQTGCKNPLMAHR